MEFLQNSLLTEDGFINEACLKELSSVIKNMPRIHERLSNDKEWVEKRFTSLGEVTGAFACYSVRSLNAPGNGLKQVSNPPYPPKLENVIGYLDACLRRNLFAENYLAELSLCDISENLYSILFDCKIFLEWNTKECLGEYWLDLDAIIQNVCISIRDERRKNDNFDYYFEKRNRS